MTVGPASFSHIRGKRFCLVQRPPFKRSRAFPMQSIFADNIHIYPDWSAVTSKIGSLLEPVPNREEDELGRPRCMMCVRRYRSLALGKDWTGDQRVIGNIRKRLLKLLVTGLYLLSIGTVGVIVAGVSSGPLYAPSCSDCGNTGGCPGSPAGVCSCPAVTRGKCVRSQ